MAIENSEALNLNISDFWSMKQEFQETYKEFFDYTQITLRRCLTLKLKSMKMCQDKDFNMGIIDGQSNKANTFNYAMTKGFTMVVDGKHEINPYQIKPLTLAQIDE